MPAGAEMYALEEEKALKKAAAFAKKIKQAESCPSITAKKLGGGKWSDGTSKLPWLCIGIMKAAQTMLASNSDDLKALLNPFDAIRIANTTEIKDYLKGCIHERMLLESKDSRRNLVFGLPLRYGCMELIVETTPLIVDGAEFGSEKRYVIPYGVCVIFRNGEPVFRVTEIV